MMIGRKTAARAGRAAKVGSALVLSAATGSLARTPEKGEIVRNGGVAIVTDVTYLAHGLPVPGATVFSDREAHPDGDGPWLRVVWSASFVDERARDNLFGWLAERIHRWEDWGGIARRKGAGALTSHLLTLLVASSVSGEASSDDAEAAA